VGISREKTVSEAKDEYPRRDPTTAHRSVADEGCLVVVPRKAVVQVLNPVAGKIYSMLDGKHTRDEIVRAVVEEFDVDEDRARRDLETFLEELREKEMLQTVPTRAGAGEGGSES
jgi:hypothetical protein